MIRLTLPIICIFGLSVLGSLPAEAQGTGELGGAANASVAYESFDPIAATEAYLARIPLEEKLRSDRYAQGGYWLQLWGFLYSVGIAGLLLFSRLSAKMRDFSERVVRIRTLQPAVYWVQYSLVTTVLALPIAIYVGYFREHQYHLSNLTLGSWFSERAVEFGAGLVQMSIALIVLYAVLRWAKKMWWLLGGLTTITLIVFALIIHPVFVAPLTNTYTPLTDERIRAPIIKMAQAHGMDTDEIWVMNESEQTSVIGASVTGIMGTQRITLNDNLLNRASLPTIKLVMAHELGHYVLNQTYYLLLSIGILIIIAFAFLKFSFNRVLMRWGTRWNVRGVDDVAGLPVFAILLSIFFFVASPAVNGIFRAHEAAADQFALSVSREPDGLAEGILLLAEYRKLSPGPVEEFLFYDHPSGRNRILAAMRWKKEHLDEIRTREAKRSGN